MCGYSRYINGLTAVIFAGAVLSVISLGCSLLPPEKPKKVYVDPREVHSLTFQGRIRCPWVITDRAIVDRCVQELNCISWKRIPDPGTRTLIRLVCLDSSGTPLLTIGWGAPEDFEVTVPGADSFFVKYEPLPTIAKLLAFNKVADAADRLRCRTVNEPWDTEHAKIVQNWWSDLQKYYKPFGKLPAPTNAEGLERALDSLPPLSLSALDQFAERP